MGKATVVEWQQKLNYMTKKQPGVPSAGSTGNVGYAPGMMSIYGGGDGANSVPTARQMNQPQELMEHRNWEQRANSMPVVGGSPKTMTGTASSTGSIGPQIGNDIAAKIMQAIQMDSRRKY